MLQILSSICTFLMKMGDFEEALLSFQQILESKRMKYGARAHASVGAALHNVAAVHLRSEQFRRALIVSTEALYVRRKALGNDHVDVAVSCSLLCV
jgi:tetratricopeptide (TPR) repeat protein